MRQFPLALGVLLIFVVSASASPLPLPITSYTDSNFLQGEGYQTFTFELPDPMRVRIEALSYTGGTDQYGAVIPGGSFDNMLWLFAGGDTATSYLTFDDNSGQNLDALIDRELAAGAYTVAITRCCALFNGDVGSPITAGFSLNPLFPDVDNTGTMIALDVSAAPEPATFALLGVGLLALGLFRRKQK